MDELRFEILPLVQMNEFGDPIDVNLIRSYCAEGLSKNPPEDRMLAWLVTSGIFPVHPEEWPEHRRSLVCQYREFVALFGMVDYETKIFENSTCVSDFGLSNNKLMELIHGDVIRTGHHLVCIPYPDTHVECDEEDQLMPFHEHMRRIERLLYIFASCNRTLSYMQGFNEISTVLYYVFSSGAVYWNFNWLEVETMVFYMFQRIFSVTQLSELFTTQDQSSLIHGRMREFMSLLGKHLPKATAIINKHNIHPLQFCFRKLNLMFAQDHEMQGLVILWDAMFAHFPNIVEFENYIMVANVRMLEELLDPDDFAQTIMVLQKLKVCDAKMLLGHANKFWKDDHP